MLSIHNVRTKSDCHFNMKGKETHQYWTEDACGKAYDKPFHPGAVAKRGGIKDLEKTTHITHQTFFKKKRLLKTHLDTF